MLSLPCETGHSLIAGMGITSVPACSRRRQLPLVLSAPICSGGLHCRQANMTHRCSCSLLHRTDSGLLHEASGDTKDIPLIEVGCARGRVQAVPIQGEAGLQSRNMPAESQGAMVLRQPEAESICRYCCFCHC